MARGGADGVSLVIAAYQAERTLAAALHSALPQLGAADEVVVVDDGSSDDTAGIARGFAPAVRLLRLDHNVGVARALNDGIAGTDRPILMFLDADDLWAPGTVAAHRQCIDSTPGVEAVFGMSAPFVDPDCVLDAAGAALVASTPMHGVHKSAMAIRRRAWDHLGGFDPAFRHADLLEWWGRATAAGLRTARHDTVVHYRRIHTANMGVLQRDEQRVQYAEVMRAISRRRREAAS